VTLFPYTTLFRSPWDGSVEDQTYVDLITKSYNTYNEYYQSFSDIDLPDNWEELFEEKYTFRDRAKDYFLKS
jgi:hypothetical protein